MIRDGRVEHEVIFPHPPERVWRALVNQAELRVWLMPTDFVPEVGRRFVFDAGPDLGEIRGEVLEVDAPKLLRCRWSGVFGDTIVSMELTPEPGGTRLRLEHAGWNENQPQQRDGFDEGWADKLTKDLPALLSGGHR